MDHEAVFVPALEIMDDDADRSSLVSVDWQMLGISDGGSLEGRFLDDTTMMDVLMARAHPEPA